MGGKVRARSGSRELMLTAYGLKPVAPVWRRSEEERAAQENSFLIHWSNPCSLSLVPDETIGDNPFDAEVSGTVPRGKKLPE